MAAMTEAGLSGAVLNLFTHGLISPMLFLIVGVIYDRAHHRDIEGFGGLMMKMPRYSSVFSLALFAALGLPGLSGFVGEALVFIGAFSVYRTVTIVSALGIVIGAAYVLWMLQRVFLGPLNPKYEGLPDISRRELITAVPIAAIVILLGVYPPPIIDMIKVSLVNLLQLIPG
jgi:NADH-quinone oxidoreductase subunit M